VRIEHRLLLAAFLALNPACTARVNGTEEVPIDGGTGTGPEPSFTATTCDLTKVREIFRGSCADTACHDSSSSAGDLDLTIADPGAALVDRAASLCEGEALVVAGEPDSSLLWNKIMGTTACGEKMPIGGDLDFADANCLHGWIVSLGSGIVECERCGGDTCVDLLADDKNCGACGNACEVGSICASGVCKGCAAGETACGTKCVDVQSDPDNCGSCGVGCGLGESCSNGTCACDGASVSFASDVAPLLGATCTDQGCHAGAKPKQGLSLLANVSYDELLGSTAQQCSDSRRLVVPGDPAESYLMSKLTGVSMCSGTLMPKADSALSAEELAVISSWICGGALDN
jgi:hypothetical protein